MTRTPRPGFTLVEVLVACGILLAVIAVLVPAVVGALLRGAELETRAEIAELEAAMKTCQRELGDVRHPLPSRLKLSEALHYPNVATPGHLDHESVLVLNQMFGPHFWPGHGKKWVDWNGNGVKDGDVVLYGDAVLVFYLGGIPSASSAECLGFAADPQNPAAAGGARKGPYFAFAPGRLARDPRDGFFRYRDPYRTGAPYLYLASRKAANDYAATDCPPWTGQTVVQPYRNGKLFLNADSFQILSAGRDGVFGPGGSWDPAAGYGSGPGAGPGADDQANFSPDLLGRPAG